MNEMPGDMPGILFAERSPLLCAVFDLLLIDVEQLAESLKVNYLALAEEFDDLVYVGVVAQSENVVISRARFLFGGKVFNEIGDRVSLYLEVSCRKRYAHSVCRVNSVAVVNIIVAFSVFVEAPCTLAVGKLADYAADDLKVREFFRTNVRQKRLALVIGHREAL